MKQSVKLLLSATLFYLTLPIFVAAKSTDEEGWAWGDDGDDAHTPIPDPVPSPKPTTVGPTGSPNPTAPDSRYNSCLKECPRVTNYNPICGSDNVTYKNEAMLRCASHCGANVQSVHEGRCAPPPEPTTPRPTTTARPSSPVESCIRNCPKLPQYNPICGTDGATYQNDAFLSCTKTCGKPVDVDYRGKCTDGPPPETSSPSTAEGPSDPDDIILKKCLNGCPATLEFKPICGSDGKTYANKALLNCQVKCGKRIEIASNGKCSSDGGPSGSGGAKPTRLEACLKRCPTLPQYNPVCGTNNQTYRNDGVMKCARNCGVDVSISSRGSCPSS